MLKTLLFCAYTPRDDAFVQNLLSKWDGEQNVVMEKLI